MPVFTETGVDAPGADNDCLPRLDLAPAIRPVAPPHSLLNTPGVVVERGSGRWVNGVNLVGYPGETPSLWTDQAEGTFLTKGEGLGMPDATFDAFVAYLPVTCKVFDYEMLQENSLTTLEATLSWGVEYALSQGVFGLANPYLGDSNLAIIGAATNTPQAGLSYLEDAIGETGRMGMIHATPSVISAWDMRPTVRGGDLFTANGTPVVSGGGYIWQSEDAGTGPDGQNPPPAGQSYVFATGPVQVYLSDVSITNVADSLDRSDNSITFRAEVAVLVIWDTQLQVAVLVDWTP